MSILLGNTLIDKDNIFPATNFDLRDIGYTFRSVYFISFVFTTELNNVTGLQVTISNSEIINQNIQRYFMTDKVIIKNLIENFDYLNEYISYLLGSRP